MTKTQLSVQLPQPLYQEAVAYARETERSLASVVRLALMAYLRDQKVTA